LREEQVALLCRLTFEEVAEVMGISLTTAKREWTYARGWLHRNIVASR
jgi:DNA-directed RNA polymerase specialized sigma24 family protein